MNSRGIIFVKRAVVFCVSFIFALALTFLICAIFGLLSVITPFNAWPYWLCFSFVLAFLWPYLEESGVIYDWFSKDWIPIQERFKDER